MVRFQGKTDKIKNFPGRHQFIEGNIFFVAEIKYLSVPFSTTPHFVIWQPFCNYNVLLQAGSKVCTAYAYDRPERGLKIKLVGGK